MNYLISKFNCYVCDDEISHVIANVKYKIEDTKKPLIIFSNSIVPLVFEINTKNENILHIKFKADNYYFLFPKFIRDFSFAKINYKSKEVFISISSKLEVNIDGEVIFEKEILNIQFSHYEMEGDLCLIYFEGNRNFLLILKEQEVCFANFYDECNIRESEKLFMCKLKDILNQGLVCQIKDKNFSSYLVYLDNEELNLKEDFIGQVFLDCVLAKNFKYCNMLLDDKLKMEDEKIISTFFEDFDFYYPLTKNDFALIKKNTLAGIYNFEILNCKITNISMCD